MYTAASSRCKVLPHTPYTTPLAQQQWGVLEIAMVVLAKPVLRRMLTIRTVCRLRHTRRGVLQSTLSPLCSSLSLSLRNNNALLVHHSYLPLSVIAEHPAPCEALSASSPCSAERPRLGFLPRTHRLSLDEGIRALELDLDLCDRRRDVIGGISLICADALDDILQSFLKHRPHTTRTSAEGARLSRESMRGLAAGIYWGSNLSTEPRRSWFGVAHHRSMGGHPRASWAYVFVLVCLVRSATGFLGNTCAGLRRAESCGKSDILRTAADRGDSSGRRGSSTFPRAAGVGGLRAAFEVELARDVEMGSVLVAGADNYGHMTFKV